MKSQSKKNKGDPTMYATMDGNGQEIMDWMLGLAPIPVSALHRRIATAIRHGFIAEDGNDYVLTDKAIKAYVFHDSKYSKLASNLRGMGGYCRYLGRGGSTKLWVFPSVGQAEDGVNFLSTLGIDVVLSEKSIIGVL